MKTRTTEFSREHLLTSPITEGSAIQNRGDDSQLIPRRLHSPHQNHKETKESITGFFIESIFGRILHKRPFKTITMEISKILFTALMPSLLALTSACSEEKVPANVIGYNHTDRDIGHFTAGGTGGGFLHAHHGGGKFSCCIGIPKHWNPTYAVTIGWTDDHDENYQERLIKVPNYEKSGNLDVHFLQNGDVKVFVTSLTLWHAEYPLKGPEAKLDP